MSEGERIARAMAYLEEWQRRAKMVSPIPRDKVDRLLEWTQAILGGSEPDVEGGSMGRMSHAASVWPYDFKEDECRCTAWGTPCHRKRAHSSPLCEPCKAHQGGTDGKDL